MKFLQVAACAAFMLSPVMAGADGDPEAVALEELDRVNLELEQVKAEIERLRRELEQRDSEPVYVQSTNADSTVASTSLSRDGTPVRSGGELYASDEALQFTYERYGPLPIFQNTRTTGSFIFSESRDVALVGGIFYDYFPDFLPNVGLSFGFKGYGVLLGIEDQDAISFGWALEGRYDIPTESIPLPYIDNFKLNASAGLAVAPDILSFGDSDRVIDWFARIGIAASEDLDVFVGFRFLQVNTQPGDTEIDDRFHVGAKWKF